MALFDLPANLKMLHIEVNEDGRSFNHSGYMVSPCEVCGEGVIHWKEVKVKNCGSLKCEKGR
jgi:hypothetical protein